ncbi:MAG: AAA family ATPase [bacterium]|nr:AAA family ATPase [bacterium]
MALERERRWLVTRLAPGALEGVRSAKIEQGYFEGDLDKPLRVRIVDGTEVHLTAKTGSGQDREEVEPEEDGKPVFIHPVVGHFLFDRCPYTLGKQRHYRDGWEIDVYDGPLAGIVVAEYEAHGAESIDDLELPPWILEAREVTDSLTNFHLARMARDLKSLAGNTPPTAEMILPSPVKKVVLTGGPCSGKSTIMEILRAEYGDRIHVVPEVATILIAQVGIVPPADGSDHLHFNRTLATVQRGFEEVAELQARRDGKKLVVLDRGSLDVVPYLHGGIIGYQRLMRTTVEREYARYDRVMYLSTPPRDIYEAKRKENPARFEDYLQACSLGERIYDVWRHHPGTLTAMGPTWDEKVQRIREGIEYELKY